MTDNLLKISKFFLYLAPFSVAIVSQSTLFPFIVGKYVFFRTVIDLALVFFVWAWATGKITNYKLQITNLWRQPLAIAVSIFIFIFILAGFFGVNPSASFWSNFERGEGVFQLIHLFIFFILLALLFTDKKSWRRMFVVMILAAVLVIAYGLAGALHIGNFVGSNLCARFAGSLGNPAYTGTFLIFAIFYAAYLAVEDWKIAKKWFWPGSAVLFFIFLFLSQTRGAVLGLGIGILAFLTYLFFTLSNKKHRWLVFAIAIFLIILGIFGIKYRQSIDLMPFCRAQGGGNRILDVNFGTETFQTRLLLWQESFKAFQERPILGWGPENFTVAFEKYYKPQFTTWYDRAHNIFFDYLVMTGILGLLSFIGIFIAYYWQLFKTVNSKRQLATGNQKLTSIPITNYPVAKQLPKGSLLITKALMFALPISYLIQGLVLFDVLPIYINLFLFLAFANWKLNNE
ncbi:O-antigen ligase family protein [Candidatus Wolfebacteria bacterium]|nr:O-antigen ligase family protein [Candidatus Wolfebacteria bacterium]